MKKQKGFTLIELVVVMAIIAVLAALVVGAIVAARQAQKNTVNKTNGRTIQTAIEAYYTKNVTYPTITAGTAFNDSTMLGTLNVATSAIQTTGCSNGGGTVQSASTGYTLTIWDNACSSTSTGNTTVSGP